MIVTNEKRGLSHVQPELTNESQSVEARKQERDLDIQEA